MMRKRFKYICSVFLATLLLSGSCRALNKEDVSKFLTVGIVGTGIILFTIDCLQGGKKSNQKDDTPPSNALKNEVPKNENLNKFTKRELLWIKLLAGCPVNNYKFKYNSCEKFRKDSNYNLEKNHDYIQIIFPNEKISEYANKEFYISGEKRNTWEQYLTSNKNILKKIQKNMALNVNRMIEFWNSKESFISWGHNYLRMTRVLISLKLFGLEEMHKNLLDKLTISFRNKAKEESLKIWKSTVDTKPLIPKDLFFRDIGIIDLK